MVERATEQHAWKDRDIPTDTVISEVRNHSYWNDLASHPGISDEVCTSNSACVRLHDVERNPDRVDRSASQDFRRNIEESTGSLQIWHAEDQFVSSQRHGYSTMENGVEQKRLTQAMGSSCKGSQWGCYWQNQVPMLVEFDMDVRFLGDWMREIGALVDTIEGKGCLPFLLGFAMRFGKASDSPMDMVYGRDTVFIDMLVAKGIASLSAHHQSAFDEIEQITFCRYGARPHWGKNTECIFLNPVSDQRQISPVRSFPGVDGAMRSARDLQLPPLFQKVVDRKSRLPYPGSVAAEDCYCTENAHCGPTALYKCVDGRHEKNARRFGRA
nr:hypothetical protein LTR18_002333 [Exophiala xenobiotica]